MGAPCPLSSSQDFCVKMNLPWYCTLFCSIQVIDQRVMYIKGIILDTGHLYEAHLSIQLLYMYVQADLMIVET